MKSCFVAVVFFLLCFSEPSFAVDGWYTEGDFEPVIRIKLTLVNMLDIDRYDCPVVINRDDFPMKELHEMWVTVVDPSLSSKMPPSKEELQFVGGHGIREETNGHQIYRQLDDLDHDGIWDELFFQTDFKAEESKTMYVYIGFSQRGWNEHGSHATIGSYCRHIIPWWESRHIGWKLWYPASVDMYGKRKPVLMSHEMCIYNLCGYNGVPQKNFDYGSDIMRVSDSFGAGGIGVFEVSARPDSVSRPRYTPHERIVPTHRNWNGDQVNDTRYAFDVIVNGPCRSIIRVKTMNWNTGGGLYEFEQFYTAYTNQSYSTCRVVCTTFKPGEEGALFACGIRKNVNQFDEYQQGGLVLSAGEDTVADPDDDTGENAGMKVDFIGTALVVKDEFAPEYRDLEAFSGNHTFAVPVTADKEYEYMIAGAWSGGEVYNTFDSFREYMVKTSLEYNNPIEVNIGGIKRKQ